MFPAERRLARHDLVWLDETRWRDAVLAPLPGVWMTALDRWFARGRPAVVRRQDGAGDDTLSLGVALPPRAGKVKIPLLVDRAAVRRAGPPLTLEAAAPSTPVHWQSWLDALSTGARGMGTPLSVYGSVSWQHLSGEPYLTQSSDVDLLWRPADRGSATRMLGMLSRWQDDSGIAADGEMQLPDGAAVAWKELLGKPRKLLVKGPTGVEMRAAEAVLSCLAASPC